MPGPVLIRTVVVALTVALVASGCTAAGTTESAPTATGPAPTSPATGDLGGPAASAPASSEPATAEPTAAATGRGTTGGSTESGSTGGGSTGGGQSGTTSSAPASGPTITYFRVAQKPSCPAGTSVNPIPGSPVVIEWKTSNVDHVAISVDGGGVYADNYPPTGSETLNFPCAGGAGDTQRHTYLLTVRNGQGKQTKQLVVTATVHDIPEV
ncbi:hypothetical protein [Micromonospora radicis]|uniref:Uncharacterized protein n=1 Tax=Micromonospora radicis TaxID=1894971 RepID=A0A418MW31_9ACTN|nr:hypothetical protein [Micromonospora radicis]RIV38904.1 hypothetical protein D2L64_10760 [Micromonospora radicis]